MAQDELVDVVDVDDNVVGQATKAEAHVHGLLHRTVIGLIINTMGEMMLVRQAADRQDAGQFVCPVGGHVRSGESSEQALRREALEEVGYKSVNSRLIGKTIYDRHVLGRQENHYFIFHEIHSDELPKLNQESVEYRLFSQDELKAQLKSDRQSFGDALIVIFEKFYPDLL